MAGKKGMRAEWEICGDLFLAMVMSVAEIGLQSERVKVFFLYLFHLSSTSKHSSFLLSSFSCLFLLSLL